MMERCLLPLSTTETTLIAPEALDLVFLLTLLILIEFLGESEILH